MSILAEQRERAKRDPGWWCHTVLGDDLWDKQVEILESVRDNRRTAVRASHGSSKSHTAARAALHFLCCFPNSLVVTTAPTYRQVRLVLWQEIHKAWGRAQERGWFGGITPTQTELHIKPGWFAIGFSASDHDDSAVQGLKSESGFVLVIIDEASGVGRNIWTGVEGLLSMQHARLLSIGNPTDPAGTFAQEFKSPDTKKFSMSVFDTPNFTKFGLTLDDFTNYADVPSKDADGNNCVVQVPLWRQKVTGNYPIPGLVTPEWVYERLRRWGEDNPTFVSRVMGNFPDTEDDTLIPLSWIERAQRATLAPGPLDQTIGGLDVALGGTAESALYSRRGPVVRKLWAARGDLTKLTPHIAARAIKDGSVDFVRVDNIGMGAYIPQFVQLLGGVSVMGVNVGQSAYDDGQFQNIKAESYWQVREAARNGQLDLDPDDEELAAQLAGIKYLLMPGGKIGIEPKKLAAKRGVPSPDRAEAVMLTYAGGRPEVWPAGVEPRVVGDAAVNRGDSPYGDPTGGAESVNEGLGAADSGGAPWSPDWG